MNAMKTCLFTLCSAVCLLVGISFASDVSLSVQPAVSYGISGSIHTFTLEASNLTGIPCSVQQMQVFHPFFSNIVASLPALQIGNGFSVPSVWLPFLPALSLFSLNPGQTGQLVLTGNLTPGAWGFSPFLLTGSLNYLCMSGGNIVSQGSLSTGSRILPIADIAVWQTQLTPPAHNSGDKIAYALHIFNQGSLSAYGVTVSDIWPQATFSLDSASAPYQAPLYSFSTGVLAPGQEWVIVLTGSLKANIPVNTLFTNDISAAIASGMEYTTGNNTASLTGIIASYFDLFLTNALPTSSAPQIAGDVVNFVIQYGNTSNAPVLNATLVASISGTNISGATYNLGTLPASSTGLVVITGHMNTSYPTGTPLCLQAQISALGEQASTGNNVLNPPVCIHVAPVADLAISTSLSPSTQLLNLSSGSTVAYIITLSNTGTLAATGATVNINLPTTLWGYTNSFSSQTGNLSSLLWTGISLNPGQSISYIITGTLGNIPLSGLQLFLSGSIGFPGIESTLLNNTSSTTSLIPGLGDLNISASLLPFTGFTAGDTLVYRILYSNEGGRTISGVSILSSLASVVNATPATWTFPALAPGQTGQILMTGNFNSFLTSGQTFVSAFTITGNGMDSNPTNNIAVVTGVIAGHPLLSVDISAHNISRPQMDTPPYGSGIQTLIQAVSGDMVQLTLNYANNGNVTGTSVVLNLSAIGGFVSLSPLNASVGTLGIGQSGTIILTGIVGPRNYISFTPTITLSSSVSNISDSVIIQEPMVCGDGLLTRNEVCDTQGQLGVIISGQVCENQQNTCVLVTKYIVNTACLTYQVGTQTGGPLCSSVQIPLSDASCKTMSTIGSPVANSNGYAVTLSCQGNNTLATTPLTIDCGNGTLLTGVGASLQGTCQYTGGFVGNAQCRVANDLNNLSCKAPVSITAGQCQSLDAHDGTVIIVDGDNDPYSADARFTCTTRNNITAQTMKIDCGNGTSYTQNNVSSFQATCHYNESTLPHNNESTLPHNRQVSCSVDGTSSPECTKNVILDQGTFGRCGDGVRQGREKCDEGNNNGKPGYECTKGCDIVDQNGANVACFNVGQTNISVQENEILPFWRTIDQKSVLTNDSCNKNNPDAVNKVRKESMKCTFKIYNGEHLQSSDNGNQPIDEFTENCDTNTRDGHAIFDYVTNLGNTQNRWSLKNAFGKYYRILGSNLLDGVYGEYKIVLNQVDYQYCDGSNWVDGLPVKRVCEVNFAVTKPYLAQKSSFGLTPKSSTINLDGFKDIQGNDLVKKTDLDKIMVLDGQTYNGGNTVKTMMSSFITKYKKLALTAKTLTDGTKVSKIPGQNIFILNKTNGDITISEKNDLGSYDKPFTMIIEGGANLIIEGSLTKTNGMFLVKGGMIKFNPDETNKCATKQTVQGIFVTDLSFGSSETLLNNNLNKARCAQGGLYVKGVLIGDGINTLVKTKRSQLNHWFMVGGSSESYVQSERRNEIFNGASVLIEYGPSLWSALPPGASEFTKALDVYKQ